MRLKFFRLSLPAFLGLGMLVSCGKDTDRPPVQIPEPQTNNAYFTYRTGSWLRYQVDTVNYLSTGQEQSTYEVLDEVVQIQEVQRSDTTWLVRRSWRKPGTHDWKPYYHYTARKTTSEGQVFIENVRWLKMPFPLEQGKQFNANKYNTVDTFGVIMAEIRAVDQPYDNDTVSFSRTAVIVYDDFRTFINDDYEEERYAAGVGLVRRTFTSLNLQKTPAEGVSYELKLLDYHIAE